MVKFQCQFGEDLRLAAYEENVQDVEGILREYPDSIQWLNNVPWQDEVICRHGQRISRKLR